MDYNGKERQISFVIPHKGREAMLRQTIQSIARQQYDLAQVEVVVVTQNEKLEPDTLPNPQQLSVTVVHRPETDTIAALRNEGVKKSSGRYVAFLDADVDISPGWIVAMLEELHADEKRVLVSCVQGCAADAPPLEKIRTALSRAASDTEVEFLPGANLLLTRKVFWEAGGFPEHLATCEDYFFSDRVNRLGKLYQSARSEFIHLGEDKTYSQMFQKEIWRGKSNLSSIRGREISLRELPSFLTPIWIFLFALAALAAILGGNLVLALLLLVLGALPIGLYTLRLYRAVSGKLPFLSILKFYALYFPARVIGLFRGMRQLVQG
jgi:glycosyltransferase involved in cell wall biosynthesis